MNRTLSSSLVVIGALAVAGFALASGSSRTSLHVQPTAVAPGGHVHVYGNAGSCTPGTTLTAISSAFPGHAYGQGTLTGRVRANHTFSFAGHLRAGVRAGTYSVSARCGGGNLGVSAHIHVS